MINIALDVQLHEEVTADEVAAMAEKMKIQSGSILSIFHIAIERNTVYFSFVYSQQCSYVSELQHLWQDIHFAVVAKRICSVIYF